MSWSLIEFIEGVDAGKRSVVSSDWIKKGENRVMVNWRAGKWKAFKSYPVHLMFQGKKIP